MSEINNLNTKVNQFPSLTWNFLKINNNTLNANIINQAKFSKIESTCDLKEIEQNNLPQEILSESTGLGKECDGKLNEIFEALKFSVKAFEFSKKDESVKIKYSVKNKSFSGDELYFHCRENSSATVTVFIESEKEIESAVLGLRLRVNCEPYSRLHLVFVNMASKNVLIFSGIASCVKDKAEVDFKELAFGASKYFSGPSFSLNGYEAGINANSIYFAAPESDYDFNYIATQRGKNTNSLYTSDGILCENSKKVWRGTIDFKNGCTDSKGDEKENVLLLSPAVENKSLPVILCAEENVEGSHGSSIGKLDQDVLFYMQSHGIDEKSAVQLVIRAKINSFCSLIDDKELTDEIKKYMDEVL